MFKMEKSNDFKFFNFALNFWKKLAHFIWFSV